jgi:hypothetical protein
VTANQRPIRPAQLPILRAALVVGVLMFGVVIVLVHRNNAFPTNPQPPELVYAQLAASIGAVVVALVMRQRIVAESNEQTQAARLIACWAVGEGAALFGGVLFMIGGDVRPYLIGLMAMAIVLARLPLPRRP